MAGYIELSKKEGSKKYPFSELAILLLMTVVFLAALVLADKNYSLVYFPVEIIKLLISFNVFLIAYSTYPQTRNIYLKILGIVCGGAGIFNFVQVIFYKLPENSYVADGLVSLLSWDFYRIFLACALILVFISFFRQLKGKGFSAIIVTLFVSLALLLIFLSLVFPISLTALRSISPFMEAVLLLLAGSGIVLVLKNRKTLEKKIYTHLFNTAFSIGLSCLILAVNHYLSGNSLELAGHMGYLAATYFLYRTTVDLSLRRPYDVLFHRLEKANLELQERAKSLIYYNGLLVKNQAFSHAFLTNIGESVIISNSQGSIEEFNPEAEKMFDYIREEIVGKNVGELFPLKILTEGKEEQDIFAKRKDGSQFPVEISKTMFQDGVQDNHYIIVLRDITKRRENERLLNLWGKVFESAVFGAVVTDAEARIQVANRGFTETTGYEEYEVLGKNPRVLKSGRHGHDFYTKMWDDLIDCGYWEGEIWNRKKSGEHYPEWLTIRAIKNSQGETANYMAFFRDITQDMRLRQEVEAAGKIQRNSLRKDRETELYTLKSIFQPLNYVSGDFFDYRFNKHKKLLQGFVLDIMGHGLATALQISAIRVLYRTALEQKEGVAEIMSWINNESAPYFFNDSFCAAICFTMDFINKKIHICSAGINNVLCLSQGGMEKIKLPGLFLGILKDESYEEKTFDLESEQSWFFISDGLSDVLKEEDMGRISTYDEAFSHFSGMISQQKVLDDATAMAVYVK